VQEVRDRLDPAENVEAVGGDDRKTPDEAVDRGALKRNSPIVA
jgi:hypothetical protein